MQWISDLPLRWKLLSAFGIVLVVIAAQSAFAYKTTAASQEASGWVDHTNQVIGTANDALANLVNMETGYRGFLVTGQDTFLDPYNSGKTAYQADLKKLHDLTADNPAQVQRWTDLDARAAAWQAQVTEPGIKLRRDVLAGTATQESIVAFELSGKGKAAMDGMRGVFADAVGAEQTLMGTRSTANTAAQELLKNVLLGGAALALLLGLAIAFGLSQMLTGSISQIATAARGLAQGDIDQRIELHSKDELGQMADVFREMIAYLGGMAEVADVISNGDLTRTVEPRSPRDALGTSFKKMISNLRELVGQVQSSAISLADTSAQLGSAAAQTGSAVQQVTRLSRT